MLFRPWHCVQSTCTTSFPSPSGSTTGGCCPWPWAAAVIATPHDTLTPRKTDFVRMVAPVCLIRKPAFIRKCPVHRCAVPARRSTASKFVDLPPLLLGGLPFDQRVSHRLVHRGDPLARLAARRGLLVQVGRDRGGPAAFCQ